MISDKLLVVPTRVLFKHFLSGWLLQVRAAVSESQQLALLGNASALADELLPRAASKLVPGGMQTSMSRDDLRSANRRGRDREQGDYEFGFYI